ncbi:MAG: four helix bundle protein [Bacteroidota bacterium]
MPVWKLGDELNARTTLLIKIAREKGDYRFADQLRGATLSVTNNIAEGFERNSTKEFIQFLGIAKGSAGEVRSLLYQASREKLIDQQQFDELRALAFELSRQLANFIRHLRTKKT